MKKLLIALMFAGLVVSGSAVVFAQDGGTPPVGEVDAPTATTAVPSPEAPSGVPVVAEPRANAPTPTGVINAFKGGEYLLGIAGSIFLIVFGVGRFWKPKSKTGKRLFAMIVAFTVTGVAAYWAGAPLSVDLLFTVAAAIWGASGMNEDAKDSGLRGEE